MMTYEQLVKQAQEILAKDPTNEKLANEVAGIIARAEKQNMELIDEAMLYGSAFRKVKKEDCQAEPSGPLQIDDSDTWGGITTEIKPLPYKSVSKEMLETMAAMRELRSSLWADWPGPVYNKEFVDTFKQDAAGMKIRKAAALEARIEAAKANGYEEKGGQATDYDRLKARPWDAATEREVDKVFKRLEDEKAGQPLRDAVTALHNQWRSDGRPHKYEVD